jgi:hypothetical protein
VFLSRKPAPQEEVCPDIVLVRHFSHRVATAYYKASGQKTQAMLIDYSKVLP